ncbi:hypothetical protein [Gimesia maris]|uniref:hypothetical protein n=1 Tax=Gimesia maris TaxID=122 RepID=UPI0030D9E670|tara:strand:- start:21141 stop:22382 length:1242 start_codon:yes stop_codon:yes gene_type:complete
MQSNSHSFNFGPNHLHVQEIIDFVESGSILQIPFDQSTLGAFDFELKLIGDLEDVEIYRDAYIENARIKRSDWIQLLRDESSKYFSDGLFAEEDAFRNYSPLFDKLQSLFRSQLISQLKDTIPFDEIEWIVDCMYCLVASRTSLGENDLLHEKLYEIYKAGGYPCGWEGVYPRGRLVVFVPGYSCQDEEVDHALWEEENIEKLKFGIGDHFSVPNEKYDYFAIRDEIGFVDGMLIEKYGIDEDTMLGDVASEPIPLSNQYIILIKVFGLEWTYVVPHMNDDSLSQRLVEYTGREGIEGIYYSVDGEKKSVEYLFYNESGECEEMIKYDGNKPSESKNKSENADPEGPTDEQRIFAALDRRFKEHEFCDLMLNLDSLISGPDEGGLYTVTLKRMPDLKYEIDILDLSSLSDSST